MKAVLLVSHGEMAKGMCDSASLFLGDNIEKLDYCCLKASDNPEDFGDIILTKINEMNSEDGVIVFADLLGGSPFNQAIQHVMTKENIELISGMNFPMLLELLSSRMFSDPDLSSLVETGKNGIIDARNYLQTMQDDDE